MNFRFFIFVLLFVSLIQANGLVKFNPQNIENIEVTITRSGTIISESGKFSNMDLTLSIPQETYYQRVNISGIENGKIQKIGESSILNFKRNDTISSFTYSYNSYIITNRRTINFPLEYNGGMESLISESNHVIINEEIRNKANELVIKAESDLDKVALIAIWINENMEYDIKEVGKNSNSLIVFETKRGVCVEYTNLFLAMVRSLGIPARAVTGYVYSPEFGWQLHSWAEVYLDEWVGVDPTWLEVGSIDATHIPLYFDNDTVLKESVSATLHSQYPLKWIGKGTLGSSTEGIEIKKINEKIPDFKINTYPNKKLEIGSEGTILFEIDVDYYMIFQANINSCKHESKILELEKNKVTYFLSPGKNYVPINFKISEMLNSNYNYLCPVVISHTLGYDVIDIEVEGRKSTESFDIYLSKINENNASFKIYSNDGKPVKVITNKENKEINVYMNSVSEDIYFVKEGINKRNLIFYNDKEVKIFDLDNLNFGTAEIIPTKIEFKEKIPNDIKSYIEMDFEFKSNDEITISYFVNGILVDSEKTNQKTYNFKKELETTKIGTQKIVVKVKSYSEEFVYENSYEVYEPIINYDIVSLGNEKYGISINGPYKEYKIYVNGKELESNISEFVRGDNEIRIIWIDIGGYERTYTSKYSTEWLSNIINVFLVISVVFIIYSFRDNILRGIKWK